MGPGGGGSFGRSPSLPPSGPMAMKSNWYNRGSPAPHTSESDVGVSRTQEQEVQEHENADNSPNTVPAVGALDASGASDPKKSPVQSSLDNLDPLRQSLPEVGEDSGE